MSFSDPPAQTELQALGSACETLAADVRAISTLAHALRLALLNIGAIKGSA